MNFDVYSYREYRRLVRDRVRDLRSRRSHFTLQKVAEKVGIQYTYLSKALRSDSVHLNEDTLFRIGEILDFHEPEIEFLMLLRSHSVSGLSSRKDRIFRQIETIAKKNIVRSKAQNNEAEQISKRTQYLLTPLAVLVHAGFAIKKFRENPLQLSQHLGIPAKQFKGLLKILEENKFIIVDWEKMRVEFNESSERDRVHYGKDHPMMRMHQLSMKSLLTSKMLQTSEDDKESFTVTFTTSAVGFDKIRAEFAEFIKRVQGTTEHERKRLCAR